MQHTVFHSLSTKIDGLKQIRERIRESACRMEPIRVGLVFDEKDGILSDSQKSEGLDRCWFLLKPQLQGTVSDLIDHVLQAFQLRPSCPNGLILFEISSKPFSVMDGFVLPWFEPISILKDRDVISVRKKGITYSLEGNNVSNLLLGNNASNLVRRMEGAQKGAAQTGALRLANGEFVKETGGYQSDEPEDEPKKEGEIQQEDLVSPQRNVTSKKRKAGQNLERSKDKKRRSEIHVCSENDPPEKQIEKTNHDGHKVKKKSARMEKKVSKAKKKSSRKCTEVNDASVVAPETSKSSDQAPQDEELEEASAKVEKRSSRSSRRKRYKRQWIREMYKIQSLSFESKEEGIKNWKQKSGKAEAKKQNSWRQRPGKVDGKEDDGQPKGLLHWKQSSQWDSSRDKRTNRDANLNGDVYNKARQMNDSDGEVVPVVIRPGHIRFESPGKEKDVPEVCNEGPEVPQKWNGITSKRKGQKWGTEKGQKWGSEQGQKRGNEQGQKRGNERNSFSRRSNFKANRREEPKILVLPKDVHLDEPLDFEKYPVIDYLPKVGDVISYRIIELTSMWTPEPSSIRIGHVSWCSDKTANLVLTQIPGHPIELKKPDEQESEPSPFENPYKEDGSLETHFTGLLDVRIIKDSSEPSAEGATSQVNNGSADNENTSNEKGEDESTQGTGLEDGEIQTNGSVTGTENGEIQANGSASAEKSVDAWEILSEALNAKKDELCQGERTWEEVQNVTSTKGAWSNAAVKRSTLGPTIAYLRSKNQI